MRSQRRPQETGPTRHSQPRDGLFYCTGLGFNIERRESADLGTLCPLGLSEHLKREASVDRDTPHAATDPTSFEKHGSRLRNLSCRWKLNTEPSQLTVITASHLNHHPLNLDSMPHIPPLLEWRPEFSSAREHWARGSLGPDINSRGQQHFVLSPPIRLPFLSAHGTFTDAQQSVLVFVDANCHDQATDQNSPAPIELTWRPVIL